MSFKYRFILSFVLLEIFFIILIVALNFLAINNSSKELISQKLESTVSFMEELLKVPLSIYDLATLDNLLDNTQKLEYINSIVVLDNQNRIISKNYAYEFMKIEDLIKNEEDTYVTNGDETYFFKCKKIYEEDVFLGSFHIIFDTTKNSLFISENKNRTLFIVIIEILISTLLSYLIGNKLTNKLTRLSELAQEIGESKKVKIPYQEQTNEIGFLAKSMNQMQIDLFARTDKLKNLALELNSQKEKLLEANKSKDDFLANMSHELKTPLNAINVISSVMMKNKLDKLDEEQVKNISIINSCGNDLLYLINDVLDVSKLEAGKINLHIEKYDLYKSMHKIEKMMKPQIEKKGLEFIFDCSENIGLLLSDEHRIEQIVKNLLSNSLKFTNKGKIRLIIEQVDNENLKIIVKDDGIGISKNNLEHIFDRFKQADSSTTRKYGGTGLGLAICKELITLLQGEIFVKSLENIGTSFTLIIPRKQSKKNTLNQIEPIEISKMEEETIPIEPSENNSILILNNDPISFLSIVVELKRKNTVDEISSFIQLKTRIKENSYKYLIIDITDINSEDLCKELEDIKEKVILVSSLDFEENLKNKGFELFPKPLDKNKFLSKIV